VLFQCIFCWLIIWIACGHIFRHTCDSVLRNLQISYQHFLCTRYNKIVQWWIFPYLMTRPVPRCPSDHCLMDRVPSNRVPNGHCVPSDRNPNRKVVASSHRRFGGAWKGNLFRKRFLTGTGLNFVCYRSQYLSQPILKSSFQLILFLKVPTQICITLGQPLTKRICVRVMIFLFLITSKMNPQIMIWSGSLTLAIYQLVKSFKFPC
jgi:hypothetical protein